MPTNAAGGRIAYEPTLDGLRAIAVLLVVAFHARVPGFRGGFVGVDIFFVLSGYLITSILRAGVKGFYVRRLLRLAPALLSMLAVYVVAAPFLWPLRGFLTHLREAAVAAFYLSDYLRVSGVWPLRHTWSLAVEAQFYLFWPFVVSRLSERRAPLVLIGSWALLTLWRLFKLATWGWDASFFPFDSHSTGLVLGALLAYVPARHPALAWPGLAALGALTASLTYLTAVSAAVGLSCAEIATALVILGAASPGPSVARSILAARPLVIVGRLSYGVYLWHYPLALYLRPMWPWWAALPAVLVFSLAAAALSYASVEKVARRARFAARPARPPMVSRTPLTSRTKQERT